MSSELTYLVLCQSLNKVIITNKEIQKKVLRIGAKSI